MTDMKAGVWLGALVIYFLMFILIVNSTTNLDVSEYNADKFANTSYTDRISANNICSLPRYYVTSSGDIDTYNNRQNDNMDCDQSSGAFFESDCNLLEGCSWEYVNSSTWWTRLWGDTDSYQCTGYINASYYGLTTDDGYKDVSNHKTDSSNLWGLAPIYSDDPCTDPEVLFDKDKCETFSCTWSPYDYTETMKGATIMNSFVDIFSWRYDFKIKNSSIALLLKIFFVIIPQLAIIISAYFLLR